MRVHVQVLTYATEVGVLEAAGAAPRQRVSSQAGVPRQRRSTAQLAGGVVHVQSPVGVLQGSAGTPGGVGCQAGQVVLACLFGQAGPRGGG